MEGRSEPASHLYYFAVGRGSWRGRISLRITDWGAFRRSRIRLLDRLLVLGMPLLERPPGSSTIDVVLEAFPGWGPNGVATNVVRIHRYGVTLYLLREQYVLHPDGSRVFVRSRERFGPVPLLLRRRKAHPARIHPEGRGATYLDMPLLGAVWRGEYKVLDPDHIDAELTCAWASARETIGRVGAPEAPASPGGARAPEEPKDLDAVVSRLRAHRDWYEAVRDRRAVFTHAYMTITERFRDAISRRSFRDPAWVIALDLAFAREYFRALDAHDLGEEIPGGWRPVFDELDRGRTTVLEELTLPMSAHIIHDLTLALRAAGTAAAGGESRIGDFHLANDVLKEGIDAIQTAVAGRYSPPLRLLDRLALRRDEVLTNYGIRLARAAAWYNAERLADPATAGAALASLSRSLEDLVDQLRRPSPASVLLGPARLLARLTRRWPGRRIV